MRGRLIQKFKVEIARLDTTATEIAGQYDPDFREIKRTDASGDGIGTVERQEHTAVILPCQVGSRTFEALQASDLGNVPQSDLVLWLHFQDLEEASLVDTATGQPLIHTGDRIVSIRDYFDEAVVLAIRTPPGLYVQEARSSGWGISMARPTRNLLRLTLAERSAV